MKAAALCLALIAGKANAHSWFGISDVDWICYLLQQLHELQGAMHRLSRFVLPGRIINIKSHFEDQLNSLFQENDRLKNENEMFLKHFFSETTACKLQIASFRDEIQGSVKSMLNDSEIIRTMFVKHQNRRKIWEHRNSENEHVFKTSRVNTKGMLFVLALFVDRKPLDCKSHSK